VPPITRKKAPVLAAEPIMAALASARGVPRVRLPVDRAALTEALGGA
jgi:hypothetical protein